MDDKLTQRHLLEILAPPSWDYSQFVTDIANDRPTSLAGCRVLPILDVFSDLSQDIESALLGTGLSNLLRRQLLTEDIVPPAPTPDFACNLIVRFLRELDVDDELIIVDPFFLSSDSADYLDLIATVLAPFKSRLRRVVTVVNPKRTTPDAFRRLQDTLGRRGFCVQVESHLSEAWHDRFWITHKRTRGLVVGTSLNGIGKKYFLLDRLSSEDVASIVDELRSSCSIPLR